MPSSCLLTERRCSWPWSFTLSRNCCISCVCDNDIWNFDRINYRSVGLISSASPEKSFLCRAVCLRKRTWKNLWEMTCKSLVLFSSCLLCFFLLVFNLMEGNSFETYPFWDWNLRNINIRELHTGEIYMYIKSWKIHPEGDQCTLDMLYVLKSLECEFSDAVMSVEKNDAQSPVFLVRSTGGFFKWVKLDFAHWFSQKYRYHSKGLAPQILGWYACWGCTGRERGRFFKTKVLRVYGQFHP